MKKLAIALLVLVGATACTPAEIAWWSDPNVPQSTKDAVWQAMNANRTSRDCNEAIERNWPGDKAWARKIVWRESTNSPGERNRSGASGCWQLMLPLHNRWFYAVGASPADWANPDVNTRAAWALYQYSCTQPGGCKSPWVLTSY